MRAKIFNYEEGFMGVRDKKPSSYFRSFKQDYRLRSITKSVILEKGRMLDIGCGGGILTESLQYYFPKAKLFGCDVSRTAIAHAKRLGSGKITYRIIKSKKLPYKNNFFDVCLCLDVLEHVPDARFFLKEVKRVLKKNGKFFLIVPCEGEFLTYTWLLQKIHLGNNLTYRFFGHIHPEFTHKNVISLLEKEGFIVNKKNYSEHAFYQVIHLLIFFAPKLFLELILGKKRAGEYTNSSLITKPKNKQDPLFIARNIWYSIFDFIMFYPMNWETIALRDFKPTAWKLHALAIKQ